MFPGIRIILADAGRQSCKLTRQLLQQDGWKLVIVKRGKRVQDRRPDFKLVILDDAGREIYYAPLVEEESTRTVMAGL